jgi:hypothetical protein
MLKGQSKQYESLLADRFELEVVRRASPCLFRYACLRVQPSSTLHVHLAQNDNLLALLKYTGL